VVQEWIESAPKSGKGGTEWLKKWLEWLKSGVTLKIFCHLQTDI